MSEASTTQTGLLHGKFHVGPSGRAVYMLAIDVPPGRRKIQPHLSLVYRGDTTNGLLGVGFELEGLKSISRVGQTPAQDGRWQDGRWSAIDYSSTDRFSLGGRRLMAVSGEYGADGTEYRTEIESWSRVTSHGSVGCGPESFTVETKSGLIMRFGATLDSRVMAVGKDAVRVWALTDLQDLFGNGLCVTYEQDSASGSYRPKSVNYTAYLKASPPLAGARSVDFTYQDRPDPVTRYVGGCPVIERKRLKTISTLSDGEPVISYSLGYDAEPVTGRSHLTSVTLADRDGNTSPKTVFSWPPEATQLLDAPQPLPPIKGVPVTTEYVTLGVNLAGTGRTDLVRVWAHPMGQTLRWAAFLANADGSYQDPVIGKPTSLPFYGSSPGLTSLDLNGDGLSELVYFYLQDGSLKYSIFTWNGTNLEPSGPFTPTVPALPQDFVPLVIPVDVSGDGRSDLVLPYNDGNSHLHYYVLMSDGTQFTAGQPNPTNLPIYTAIPDKLVPGRLTSSAPQDLIYGVSTGTSIDVYSLLSNGATFDVDPSPVKIPMTGDAYSKIVPIDTNGDGLTDVGFMWIPPGTGNENYKLRTLVSNGARLQIPGDAADPVSLPGNTGSVIPTQLTGTPETDLVYAAMQGDDSIVLTPLVANHGSFVLQKPIHTGVVAEPRQVVAPDISGSGKNDVLLPAVNSEGSAPQFQVLSSNQSTTGLVTAVDNGIGGTLSIEYRPITDEQVYADKLPVSTEKKVSAQKVSPLAVAGATNAATVGIGTSSQSTSPGPTRRRYTGPFNVVWRHTQTAGPESTYTYIHHYSAGVVSLDGRGWLGFGAIAKNDVDATAVIETTFHQDFPLTARVASRIVGWAAANGTSPIPPTAQKLKTVSNAYTTAPSKLTPRVVTVEKHKTTTTLYPDTVGDPVVYSSVHTYDSYGNIVLTHYSNQGNPDTTLYTHKKYTYDSTAWNLGQLEQVTLSSDKAGKQILRQTRFVHDPTTRVVKQKTAWNNSDPEQSIVTTFTHDEKFGNVLTKSNNMGAKRSFSFGPETAFSLPSSHSRWNGLIELVDSYVYDMAYGRWTQHTDANQNLRTRFLDGFGRTITVNTPDPNGELVVMVTYERSLTNSSGYTRTTCRRQDWEGTLWRATTDVLDGFGRKVGTNLFGIEDLLETTKRRCVERRLNSRGRMTAQTLPHFEEEPVLWATKIYDPLSRVIEMVKPTTSETSLTSKVFHFGADRITIVGQGSSDPIITIDRRAFYRGRPLVVERGRATDHVSQFIYDALGRPRSATAPGSSPQDVRYDQIGAPCRLSDASFGTTVITNNYVGRTRTATYANGNAVTQSFDPLGRVDSIALSDGSKYVLSYDAPTTRNGMGRLTGVLHTDGTGKTISSSAVLSYDAAGHTTRKELTFDGMSYVQKHGISPAARLTAHTFPDGSVSTYNYDALGQPQDFTYTPHDSGTPVPIASYSNFTAFGHPRHVTHGNGTTTSYGYTPTGALHQHTVQSAQGRTLLDRTLCRDEHERVQSIEDPTDTAASATYHYDSFGQLHSVVTASSTEVYSYHQSGDISQRGSTAITYKGSQIDVHPAADPDYIIDHDVAGNRTQVRSGMNDTVRYSYNSRNELIGVTGKTSTSFLYDHTGRRVLKSSVNGDKTVYVSPEYAVQTVDTSSTGWKLLRDPFGVCGLVSTPASGDERILHTTCDQVSSIILVTDSKGAVDNRLQYSAYGSLAAGTLPNAMLPMFGSKEFDRETGLYYFNARYYDPAIGRFITADSGLGARLYRVNALNRFAFTLNDPINHTDPSGHGVFDWLLTLFIDVGEIITGVIVGAAGTESLSRAFLGAGIAGANYDITSISKGRQFSWAEYGLNEAAGALAGLLLGGGGDDDVAGAVDDGQPPPDANLQLAPNADFDAWMANEENIIPDDVDDFDVQDPLGWNRAIANVPPALRRYGPAVAAITTTWLVGQMGEHSNDNEGGFHPIMEERNIVDEGTRDDSEKFNADDFAKMERLLHLS